MSRRTLALALGTTVLSACGTSVSLGDQAADRAQPSASPPAGSYPLPTRATTATPEASLTPPHTASEPRPARHRRPRPRLDDWDVGASPLPLGPDGFGRVLRTPPELRVRRMPTVDLLPPPATRRFQADVAPVSAAVRRRLGRAWTPRCPVGLQDLRYVTVSFWGFDRRPHTGELVLHERVAGEVVGVFRTLYRERFPIEQMRLVTAADLKAPPTGDGNNTAALVCRRVRGDDEWSSHAYGLAVDVNPFQNPYRDGDLVLPELAGAYLDRGWRRPGMIHPHGVVVDAFASIGWAWGGDFESLSDPMHFSATGG
ncbi:MAG: M15 family metallopeptidase [Actinomycetota bacterium]|nr:M15 family metallopeptidase [Actinomycetota bacterium]